MANYNTAYATNHRLEIAGATDLNYFCQTVELPGLSAEGVETPWKGTPGYWQADRIDYDPLPITFLVDEEFKNYLYIYQWMLSCTTKDTPLSRQKDATLHILTGNKTKNLEVQFLGCFPTSLGNISFESAVTDPNAITCALTLRYQMFTILG